MGAGGGTAAASFKAYGPAVAQGIGGMMQGRAEAAAAETQASTAFFNAETNIATAALEAIMFRRQARADIGARRAGFAGAGLRGGTMIEVLAADARLYEQQAALVELEGATGAAAAMMRGRYAQQTGANQRLAGALTMPVSLMGDEAAVTYMGQQIFS